MAGLDQTQMPFAVNGVASRYPKTSSPSITPTSATGGSNVVDHAGVPSSSSGPRPDVRQSTHARPAKPMAEATTFSATFSTGSYSEETPIVVGQAIVEENRPENGASHFQSSSLEESKDAAKKEADELYSRLLHDTHGTLGPSAIPNDGANGYEDKYGEAPDTKSGTDEKDWMAANKYANKSYDDPSSFLSEQDESIVREENIVSIDDGDGSDNDNF